MTILGKDSMIQKLFNILSSQELYLINFKQNLTQNFDCGLNHLPNQVSNLFSPKRGMMNRMTPSKAFDTFTDRVKLAGVQFEEPSSHNYSMRVEKNAKVIDNVES